MASKNLKAAATAGVTVFDQIASGSVIDAQDVQNVQNVQTTKDRKDVQSAPSVKPGIPAKEEMERLNLKIPKKDKEYLTIAAARASIAQRRSVSLTQYLLDLIAADREKHKDD